MNKQRVSIIIASLVLLFFLGYSFFSLYLSYTKNQSTFQEHFSVFSGRAFSAFRSSNLSPNDFAAFLRPAAQSQKAAALLYLSDPDGYIRYLYLNDRDLKTSLPDPEMLHISDLEELSDSGKLLSLTMTAGSDTGTLTAGAFYRRIDRNDIFQIVRPLFPALALFALLLLLLILNSSKGKQGGEANTEVDADDGAIIEKEPSESGNALPQGLSQQNSAVGVSLSPYSPTTGLSWESFLDERLTNELKRSASSEQELSFALISCPSFKNPSMYSQMAMKLKRVFTMGDLIFEYTLHQEKAFAIILPDTDLMVSIDLVKEFLNDADLSRDRCTGGAAAGLSSRSGRLVDASILKKEASAALSRAKKDPETNIIGFKPDPGKFRNYLATKREKQ